ncbi:hypothetical protein QA639_09695 [Bradyrhizobium pachyrhizi]|uniref:hypothetical protein n=1 Tax=Bradyrhizobium pachyrhizi TaxID=280333 RepID=UPI0024B07F65|nr:hypothetical protein [Bradyrhizobium pachyrhizi]WFU60167.1 hypothetical protein QA639_09695 [Bradyrhizobium pachyrhizi]
MPVKFPSHIEAITKQIALVEEIVARAVDLLKLPADSFLGRKTLEPFPQEESKYGEAQDRGRPT